MRTNRLLDPPATRFRTALLVAFALSLAMSGTALAKGQGRPGGKSCTPVAPTALVDNNWAWSESGSWGYPGQQLAYFINVINYDVGCAAGTFVIDVHAPTSFQVTVPANTISLKASTNGYLWAYVTSPTTVASGDYPLTVTVARTGATRQHQRRVTTRCIRRIRSRPLCSGQTPVKVKCLMGARSASPSPRKTTTQSAGSS